MEDEQWPPIVLSEHDKFVDPSQPDYNRVVWMGNSMSEHFITGIYAEGFRDVARLATNYVLNDPRNPEFRDNRVVFPIVFLYRHHIELLLKQLYLACADLLEYEQTSIGGHNLVTLWKNVRPLVERALPYNDLSQNAHVARLLDEWCTFDPAGEATRYPKSKKRERHFQNPDSLNLRHFANVAERLSEYLLALNFGVECELDSRDNGLYWGQY